MSTQKNSTWNKHSRYVSGGVTEVNQTALEWWERTVFTPHENDRAYVVDQTTQGRLDLISAIFLGEPRFWWLIAQYNNILDPASEVVLGLKLRIPPTSVVADLLNGKLGGVPSQREVPITVLPLV